MKKLLGISLVAVLTATPLMAGAADVTLITPNPATTDVATTSYVKGAYNELGKAINTKQDQLTAGGTDVDTAVVQAAGIHSTAGEASDTALASEKAVLTAISAADSAMNTRVTDLETTVGDSDSGLVKDVADNAAAIAAEVTRATGVEEGLDTRLSTAEKDIDVLQAANAALGQTYATRAQVTANINEATGSKTGASLDVNFGAIKTDTSALTVSVPQTVSVNLVQDWSTGTPVPTTLNLGGVADKPVSGTATTTIAASTATGDITGIDISAPATYQEANN